MQQLQAFVPNGIAWRKSVSLRSTRVLEPSTEYQRSEDSQKNNEMADLLFVPSSPQMQEVKDESFDDKVLASNNLSLVYFTSPWCKSPMESTLQRVIIDQQDNTAVQFFQMDTDESYDTVTDFNVRFIPSVGLFKDGAMVSEIVGLVSASVIKEQIEKYLAEEQQEF